jgi:hypothetical protein
MLRAAKESVLLDVKKEFRVQLKSKSGEFVTTTPPPPPPPSSAHLTNPTQPNQKQMVGPLQHHRYNAAAGGEGGVPRLQA